MREVKNRVQAGWSRWRQVSRVIGDRRTAARMKGKIYETVVRLKIRCMVWRQGAELDVAELKMLRFWLGVSRRCRIRN